MRVALVVHGLPPHARTGVETHAAALASALAARGLEVEVFAPRLLAGLAPYAQRREQRDGWAVTWIHIPGSGDSSPGSHEGDMREAFGAFLDRERPELVHFEHLLRVGGGAVQAAKQRNIPTLFQAHDFHLASDSYTLCAPDLGDLDLGDLEGQARARLGRAFLDGLEHLGDHHACVRPGDLSADESQRLQAILHGPAPELEGLEEALAAARNRLEQSRVLFASFDRRFASSPLLANRLGEPFGRAVELHPAGIDLAPLAMSPPERFPGAPLRLGFMGGVLKHKGLHLLLDAFARLDPKQVTLSIHGDSSDRVYRDQMRARAEEVGACWCGSYRAEEVGRVLAGIDVLVVPSLWVENAPFVIMEAFAAGRPVVAARSEFLEERVRDGIDGLLFERGDAGSLETTLRRLLSEETLLPTLVEGVRPPLELSVEAEQWIATYESLVAERRAALPRPALPEHLKPFARRFEALNRLPIRTLFARVTAGLESLGDQMGLEADPREYLALAVGRGSSLRDGAVEGRRALGEWERRTGWREQQLQDLERKLDWFEQQIQGWRGEFKGLEADHQRLTLAKEASDAALSELRRERDWLSEVAEDREQSRIEADRCLENARESMQSLEAERRWLQQTFTSLGEEMDWLRASLKDAEVRARHQDLLLQETAASREEVELRLVVLEKELDALSAHETWLRGEVQILLEGVLKGTAVPEAELPGPEDVARNLAQGSRELGRILQELNWRREEMAVAGSSAQTLRARLAGGSLADRARRWTEEGQETST